MSLLSIFGPSYSPPPPQTTSSSGTETGTGDTSDTSTVSASSGTSGADGQSSTADGGSDSGTGTAGPLPPKGPATDRPPAAEPEQSAFEKFLNGSVMTDAERLDLAFASGLDEAMARRYAESARLTVISEGQLARLRSGDLTGADLARDAKALRDLQAPERETRLDRAA
ncbi:hypothetical protein JSE7799_01283 [Jannaschia seosinensis]|uniref:Uncharacterized protein n=1 Tax=Jannaschia seosinensis TaxID=313367 RepID=A0A0M7B932_9RHOB|nr:hypothetical protein [Jannaschia seosinensis]CUH37325.1 hypothetical protein JSE7799_01283 [Jannaschia seosinensis]